MRKIFSLKSAAIAFAFLCTAVSAQAATTQYRLEATPTSTNGFTEGFSIVFDDLDMDMLFSLDELVDFSGVNALNATINGDVFLPVLLEIAELPALTDGGDPDWLFALTNANGLLVYLFAFEPNQYAYSLNPVPSTVPLPAGGLLLVTGLIGMAALRRRLR